jgi:hypothetical protein
MKSFICKTIILLIVAASSLGAAGSKSSTHISPADMLTIPKCGDFNIDGTGNNAAWKKAEWNLMTKISPGGKDYETKFKIMYSGTGIYILISGQDDKITTQFDKDFGRLYEADVFEVFFHPNPRVPAYFEYEINALNKELVLMLDKSNGKNTSGAPKSYENERRIKKMVSVSGGEMVMGGAIKSWTAELFFPFQLLSDLPNVPPKSGSIWNINLCRLDYDTGTKVKWSWTPTIVSTFHELDKFRSFTFE